MKQLIAQLSCAGLAIFLLTACGAPAIAPKQSQPAAVPAPTAAIDKSGKVIETMNTAGYTYVQVDTGKEQFWAATPEVTVKVGDRVVVPDGLPMQNYESKSLNRKFELVYFVPFLEINGVASTGMSGAKPDGHPPVSGMPGMPSAPAAHAATATNIDLTGIKKADQTVAEIYAQKSTLAGKPVTIRGKVVKCTSGIMGKNWLHIQDGSGQPGTNDLTINTTATANIGDTVVVSGNLTADKDFGHGYKYAVIIEDAQLAKE